MSPRSKFIATLLACILSVSVLGGSFVYVSMNVRSADTELAAIDARIAALYHERRQAETTVEFLELRKDDIARIRRFFLDPKRPIDFIEELERLARVTHNTLTLNINEGNNQPSVLSLGISVDGTQSSIRTFIRLLDTIPYSITVDSVNFKIPNSSSEIGSGDGQDPPAKLTAVIQGKTF